MVAGAGAVVVVVAVDIGPPVQPRAKVLEGECKLEVDGDKDDTTEPKPLLLVSVQLFWWSVEWACEVLAFAGGGH